MKFIKNNIKYLILIALMIILPQGVLLFAPNKSGYILQLLVMLLLYMYWTSSWNIISGYVGWMSLGHATYIGLGAYTSTICFMYLDISPWIGMFIGGLIAGIVSCLVGYPTFKLRGSYYTLSTVALVNTMRIIFLSEDKIFGFETFAAMGMKLPWLGGHFIDMQSLDRSFFYYIVLALLVIILLISNAISKSKTGYYFAAIKTNQNAAATLGVNVENYKLRAQFISAFFTAVGGAVYAQLLQYIDPSSFFSSDLSVQIALMAIIGGRGSLWGPVIGALLLYPVSEYLRSTIGSSLPGSSLAIYGLILMLVIYFMPQGIFSYLEKLASFVKSKFKKTAGEV
ncbi:MAG: branched-chain amino acid ABC transporter permease [Saccharofermentanales bacterium]